MTEPYARPITGMSLIESSGYARPCRTALNVCFIRPGSWSFSCCFQKTSILREAFRNRSSSAPLALYIARKQKGSATISTHGCQNSLMPLFTSIIRARCSRLAARKRAPRPLVSRKFLRLTHPGYECSKENVEAMMTCKDVMTPDPNCCCPNDSVSHAAEIMRDEDVGPVPVVEDQKQKKLTGIITDRDIAVKVVASGKD